MPLLNGPVVNGWAIIDVLVGASEPRKRLLAKHKMRIPPPVHVRALIDTGASMSGFAPRVFEELDLTPVTTGPILTPSTPPDAPASFDMYDVSLSLVAGGASHPFPDTLVVAADCWHPGEGMEALIGVDILSRCFFQFVGPERRFTLAF